MTVFLLRRYPIKSMLGEELTVADVTADGLEGDRRLALLHRDTGKVVSAKTPRLWRDMLTFTATGYPDVTITRDGTDIAAASPDVDETLSQALNADVTLVDTPPPGATLDRSRPEEVLRDGITAVTESDVVELTGITFHDFAAVHLVTTSTLEAVGTEVVRYRPNIVVATDGTGFPENDWLDRDLRIGAELTLRVVARTPRCAVPTLEHGALPRDTGALRVPAARNRVPPMRGMSEQPCAGVYAQVLCPGRVRQGDVVQILE